MTIGRSFLLWLLGVLLVILVLVSALVLWHERDVLEDELSNQGRLLARTLAVAAAEGGSPEYLAVVSMGDLRSGEVRDASGSLLWRYGPSPDEAATIEPSLLRIEERVLLEPGHDTAGGVFNVVLLLSRSRIDSHLARPAGGYGPRGQGGSPAASPGRLGALVPGRGAGGAPGRRGTHR
jgi:hypothetical protein